LEKRSDQTPLPEDLAVSGPTVSVVIPAYKAAGTIARALDSVFAQTRPADEVLAIDDGSPDDLAAAVAPYRDRIRYVRKPNGGAASARNRGLEEATGDLVALLDADDYWGSTKLARQLDVFARHPEVGIVAGRWLEQEPGHEPAPSDEKPARFYDRVLRPRGAAVLDVARLIWTSALIFRRSLLGDERFDTTLRTAQDIDMWVRLVQKAPTYLIGEPLQTYYLTPGSLSRSDVAADSRNMLRVLGRCRHLLGRWGLRGWEAEIYRDWAAGHLAAGEPRKAVAPAWGRLVRQPWSPQAWWIVAKSLALSLSGQRSAFSLQPDRGGGCGSADR
jgi:glycosyltransferase involved in cell wall biosynthesis